MVSFILTRYSRPTPTSRSFLVTYPREWENHVDDTPPKFNSSRMKNESWKTFKHFCTKGGPYFSKFFLYFQPIPLFCLCTCKKISGCFSPVFLLFHFFPGVFKIIFSGRWSSFLLRCWSLTLQDKVFQQTVCNGQTARALTCQICGE